MNPRDIAGERKKKKKKSNKKTNTNNQKQKNKQTTKQQQQANKQTNKNNPTHSHPSQYLSSTPHERARGGALVIETHTTQLKSNTLDALVTSRLTPPIIGHWPNSNVLEF